MSGFKLDDNIPLPPKVTVNGETVDGRPYTINHEALEECFVEEVQEDSRWVPFKPNQPKCPGDTCNPQVGRCNKCGDIFPCPSGNCGHFNCADPSLSGLDCPGNGTETPEGFYVIESEDSSGSTECGSLQGQEERLQPEEPLD